MNKTNIKRVKALGFALLTTIALSACAQAPSTEESQETSSKYKQYILFNVNDMECKVLADTVTGNLSFTTYRLEDGTKIIVSNASGELLAYDILSTEMSELMDDVNKESDKPILTLD